ncbi:hypothetical protein D9619_010170 [Psilocybe cf. subviscida]|uniref:Uncharacterized protein n=1 Tax=Psilocybe cf. subviscida TaxID=2480587 RepID=A0A8H5ASJ5_9AGAR|nr:hypothetical protein D9619_010170 [Psilocybe cf. subviscida]
MPSLFSRKRHESTPAPQTAPSPPPKDLSTPARSLHSNPYSRPSQSSFNPNPNSSDSYSHSLPTARTRRTSTPAYSPSYPSSSSSSSSSPSPRPNARPPLAHRPLSTAHSSLPRRPSPLSGPPLVAPSTVTASSHSHSYLQSIAHEEGLSPLARPRAEGSRLPPAPRPQSELLLPSRSSAGASNERAPKPDTKRSISVVGDDWTRAYEAVEYDLDLDFGWLRSRENAAVEPGGDDDGYSEDSDSEALGETDVMLQVDPRTGPGDSNHSSSTGEHVSANSSTRHARTPSAGWQAWSGNHDAVDVGVGAAVSSPHAEQTYSSRAP